MHDALPIYTIIHRLLLLGLGGALLCLAIIGGEQKHPLPPVPTPLQFQHSFSRHDWTLSIAQPTFLLFP